jgi:subtilisin family serine protease
MMTSLGLFARGMLACAIALLAVLAPGCAITSPDNAARAAEGDTLPKQLVERVVVVTLAPASSDSTDRITAELASAHGLRHVGAFPLTSIGVHCVVFAVPSDRAMEEVVRALATDPRVESAQPNQVFRSLATGPTDPYASFQYGARVIRAPQAHRWATGRGVTVAVIDTGIETDHRDLLGRVAKTANFVDGGAQSFALDRHGTAVAGVIGARANNDEGIFGVAPEADLIGIKACWHSTAGGLEARCSSWTLAKAIDFAVINGTRVVNLSLGGPPDPLLARLIAKAIERGATVVAAAMEGADAPGFPASLPEVIGVVASDSKNDVRSSERNRATMLAAPGVEILTTAPPQAYAFLSGTSLAAAHVSGVVALLLEREPMMAPSQVRLVLFQTAHSVTGSGAGAIRLVDACAALARLVGSGASACD